MQRVRYIELVYDRFAVQFCLDARLDNKRARKAVLGEHVKFLVEAIEDAFRLLPRPHQFMLQFMITRGWSAMAVLRFFMSGFTLPQLLRQVRASPLAQYFEQVKRLCVWIDERLDRFLGLVEVFDKGSFFEVPPAFAVFGVPFTQVLLTTADVHAIVQSLDAVNEVPASLRPYLMTGLAPRGFAPFWIRVYGRV